MVLLGAVADFFLLFAAPSAVLALLALRAFLRRGSAPGPQVERAARLLLLAAALPPAMVLATVAVTGGAPLRTTGGLVFLGYGLAAGALGPVGAWLFHRAAAAPLRRTVKAAETVPLLLVLMDLVLVYNAAVQAP